MCIKNRTKKKGFSFKKDKLRRKIFESENVPKGEVSFKGFLRKIHFKSHYHFLPWNIILLYNNI